MLSDEEIRELLAQVEVRRWKGHVYRHMFADIPPDRENVRGARWNLSRAGRRWAGRQQHRGASGEQVDQPR